MENKEIVQDSRHFIVKNIPIEDIVVPIRIREDDTPSKDLMLSIKEWGLLQPIVVKPSSVEDNYHLIHGYRRLLCYAELGEETIPAIVNLKLGEENVRHLEAVYNSNKRYTMGEIIEFTRFLESQQRFFVASDIDNLIGLEPGDYLKLKAVVEFGDPEVMDKLLKGKMTIKQAFKKTEKLIKELEEGKTSGELLDEEDLDKLPEPNKQTSDNRKPLSAALSKAVEDRDKFTCQACGLKGITFSRIFEKHHIIPVCLGGLDELSNLILLCPNCHKLVHLFSFGDLVIEEKDADKFKNIIRLGNIIKIKMKDSGKDIDYFRSIMAS